MSTTIQNDLKLNCGIIYNNKFYNSISINPKFVNYTNLNSSGALIGLKNYNDRIKRIKEFKKEEQIEIIKDSIFIFTKTISDIIRLGTKKFYFKNESGVIEYNLWVDDIDSDIFSSLITTPDAFLILYHICGILRGSANVIEQIQCQKCGFLNTFESNWLEDCVNKNKNITSPFIEYQFEENIKIDIDEEDKTQVLVFDTVILKYPNLDQVAKITAYFLENDFKALFDSSNDKKDIEINISLGMHLSRSNALNYLVYELQNSQKLNTKLGVFNFDKVNEITKKNIVSRYLQGGNERDLRNLLIFVSDMTHDYYFNGDDRELNCKFDFNEKLKKENADIEESLCNNELNSLYDYSNMAFFFVETIFSLMEKNQMIHSSGKNQKELSQTKPLKRIDPTKILVS